MSGKRRWHHRHRPPTLHRLATGVAVLCIVSGAFFVSSVIYVNANGARSVGGWAPGQAGGQAAGPSVSTPAEVVPRPPVQATPEGMLQLLTELLPDGKTHDYAVHAGRDLEAELYFDRGQARGRIRVVLGPSLTPEQRASRSCTQEDLQQECGLLPDGALIHLKAGASCLQDMISEVNRPDGSQVRVEIGNCTVDRRRPSGQPDAGSAPPQILSLGEAQLLAADDRWNRKMSPDLVEAGRQKFADADQIPDPGRPVRIRTS